MFKIDSNKSVKTRIPLILSNYRVLHFDEEPILFIGTNCYGDKVVGTYVDDDYSLKMTRFFHILLTSKQYFDFLHQKISYRDLIKKNDEIYIIDKCYIENTTKVYLVSAEDIPEDYMPYEESFCPEIEYSYDLSFCLALKGLIADLNQAIPKKVSKVQSTFSDMLETVLKNLKEFKITPQVRLLPSEPGSFRLNFNVNLYDNISQVDLFPSDEAITKFLNQFLHYSFAYLPLEVEDILKNNGVNSKKFLELTETFNSIYKSANIVCPVGSDKVIITELENISEGLEELSKEVGTSYNDIQVLKLGKEEMAIGHIDTDFRDKINTTVYLFEKSNGEAIVDTEPKQYKICIYHLNTSSRLGNAAIFNLNSDTEMSKPKIKIMGDIPLEETIFTESLHKNRWIIVNAIATRKGVKYSKLDIIP